MEEFEDIRLKEIGDLTDEDKTVLKEHSADLTSEEKEVFKDVITPEPPPEDFKFKSADEFDERVGTIVSNALKENQPPKAPEPPAPTGEDKIFTDQPKDWEEAGRRIVSAVEDRFSKKDAEVRARVQKINEDYDQEIVDIRKTNSDIPAKGTDEGDTFERELAEIGTKFRGVTNMNEAFEIYEALETKKKEPPDKQKGLAGKVGKSGGAAPPPKEHKYSRIAEKSMDDLVSEDMAREGIS